jgi:magnesium chelatase family protein
MSSKLVKTYCQLDGTAEEMLRMAMNELNFSARAYDRILKVARTIADLDNAENIQANHLGEAIQYRTLDRNLWV